VWSDRPDGKDVCKQCVDASGTQTMIGCGRSDLVAPGAGP
jgi:hypothetical protein